MRRRRKNKNTHRESTFLFVIGHKRTKTPTNKQTNRTELFQGRNHKRFFLNYFHEKKCIGWNLVIERNDKSQSIIFLRHRKFNVLKVIAIANEREKKPNQNLPPTHIVSVCHSVQSVRLFSILSLTLGSTWFMYFLLHIQKKARSASTNTIITHANKITTEKLRQNQWKE